MGRVNKGKLQQSPNNLARTGSARTRLVLEQPRPVVLSSGERKFCLQFPIPREFPTKLAKFKTFPTPY